MLSESSMLQLDVLLFKIRSLPSDFHAVKMSMWHKAGAAQQQAETYLGMRNRQAHTQSLGCSSGGQLMHSVLILKSIVLANASNSASPADLHG